MKHHHEKGTFEEIEVQTILFKEDCTFEIEIDLDGEVSVTTEILIHAGTKIGAIDVLVLGDICNITFLSGHTASNVPMNYIEIW